ncbi:hypothetical protein [Streptomyces sp. NPDC059651]|uniref:hypothetical protein n=1 Tax=Streptomyces sp. NPDC059651 TaxID=3346897 RepID=UPI0036BD8F33
MTTPKRGEYTVQAVDQNSRHAALLDSYGIETGKMIYVTRLSPLSIRTPNGTSVDLDEVEWESMELVHESERD